jgi:hypothetical protein
MEPANYNSEGGNPAQKDTMPNQDDDEKIELDLGEEDFHYSAEFDISDIRFDRASNKTRTRLDLIMKADHPLNVMRVYLALRAYVFKIEQEMGIFEEDEGEH